MDKLRNELSQTWGQSPALPLPSHANARTSLLARGLSLLCCKVGRKLPSYSLGRVLAVQLCSAHRAAHSRCSLDGTFSSPVSLTLAASAQLRNVPIFPFLTVPRKVTSPQKTRTTTLGRGAYVQLPGHCESPGNRKVHPPPPPGAQSARRRVRSLTGNWDARRADLFSTSRFIMRDISAARLIPLAAVCSGGGRGGEQGERRALWLPGRPRPLCVLAKPPFSPGPGFLWRCEITTPRLLLSAYYVPATALRTARD